jgi:hypothetical protein
MLGGGAERARASTDTSRSWATGVTELRQRTATAAEFVLGKRVAGSLKNLSCDAGRQTAARCDSAFI